MKTVIFYTNSNGLMNKINELNILIEQYNIKIICVTETHLNPEVKDSEVLLENFKIYRVDRKNGQKGGGSCIFIHKSIDAELCSNFNAPESVGLDLKINNHFLKIVCLYRSQNLENVEQYKLLSQVENLNINQSEDLLLFGDFNFNSVNWDSLTVDCNENTRDHNLILQRQYLDAFSSKGLTPVLQNGTVTRRRMVGDNLQESHLDQVLCSNEDIVLSAETVSPVGKSDHLGILVEIKLNNNIQYIQTQKENWSKFPTAKIQSLGADINWQYSSNILSSNEMWVELASKIGQISSHVPKMNLKSTKNGDIITKVPWDCTALKRKRKEKDQAWKIFDSSPAAQTFNVALQKQEEFENLQSKKVTEYEKKIVGAMKTKPKVFYSYLQKKRKIKESVSALKDEFGKLSSSPEQAAGLLASFFASTFTNEPMGPLEEKCYVAPENEIGDLIISHDVVKKLLLKLDQSKSMGPDGIHPKLLATLSTNNQFVEAITLLFQKCYSSKEMPLVWKTANVTALHKKGSKTDPCNYRPISLTCILCKVYETIIRSHIFEHVSHLISKKQHGFMPARSCLSNLLESIDIINDMLSTGEYVDIFYLDFQKAFDTVPHFRLIEKLKSYGLSGTILDVIADFLSNRTFQVLVGNAHSNHHCVTSGIPQGSVLGPLLFVLYINDLPDHILNSVSLFADDLKMYGPSSKNDTLQADLDELAAWQDTWLLRFNTTDGKCKVMHVGSHNPRNKYYLDSVELPKIDSEKDLGVLVSENWKWDQHISSIVKKATSMSAWVLRTVISRSPEVMLQIFKTFIRPHLEYCVQLWSPLPTHGNWGMIMAIENVQRQFTRAIHGIGLLPYKIRLQKLGLTTLLERRARGDLIETFRILSGIADYGSSLLQTSRSGRNLISRPGDQGNFKFPFFSRRVVHYWNKIPLFVRNSENTNQFKNRLDKFRELNLGQNGHYWELSLEIFNRINDDNRHNYVNFVQNNPVFAHLNHISTHLN